MSSIFDKLTNIQTSQKTVRVFVQTLIISGAAIIVGLFVYMTNQIDESHNSIYILTKGGEIFRGDRADQKAVRPIEAKAHVRKFINLFFSFNKLSYEQQINESYDLGGSTISLLHQQLEKGNWYAQVKQYNVIQSVAIQSIEFTDQEMPPYQIAAHFIVSVEAEIATPRKYEILAHFRVRDAGGERNERNPHNMFIDEMEITNWTEVKEE